MSRTLQLWLVMLATGANAGGPNPYLSQAKVFHQGLDFEKCLKRIDQAGKWDNSKAQLAEIELYSGLCHLALGDEKEARESFELALTLDPTLALPSMQGPKVAALFEKARSRVSSTLPEKPAEPAPSVKQVEPVLDAPRRVELVPSQAPAKLILPEPPPKERRLAVPIAIGVASVVALGVAVGFGLQARSLERQANEAPFESDIARLGQQAKTHALVANVAYGVSGAAAVGAVVSWLLLN